MQEELEHLNEASAEINRLELQLDVSKVWFHLESRILSHIHTHTQCYRNPVLSIQDARSGYRKILTESARKLNAQSSQLGGCIEKARPYYEARRLAKEVHSNHDDFPVSIWKNTTVEIQEINNLSVNSSVLQRDVELSALYWECACCTQP